MEEEKLLDRALYKKVKGMNRAEMEQTFQNIYSLGYEKALSECAVELNTDELCEEFRKIKGIGEVRINQIMDIINNKLNIENSDETDEVCEQN